MYFAGHENQGPIPRRLVRGIYDKRHPNERHLPRISECVVHLGLLDRFVMLQHDVDDWGKEADMAKDAAWTLYCNAAAHRFLKWSQTPEVREGDIPPIDILLVWHTYMLNTMAYQRYEKNFLKGRLSHGIDWGQVLPFIDAGAATDTFRGEGRIPTPLSVGDDPLAALRNGQLRDIAPPAHDFDLVAAVNRQMNFAGRMYMLNMLPSPFLGDILRDCIGRYEKFFTLVTENRGVPLAPTPGIDLVWHTHQVSPDRYRAYATERTGRVVKHDDGLPGGNISVSYKVARKLWRKRFGGEYMVCYCERCFPLPPGAKPFHQPKIPMDCGVDCDNSCWSCSSGFDCDAGSCRTGCQGMTGW